MTSLLALANSVLGSRPEPSISNFEIQFSLKTKNGLNLKKILLLAKRFLTSFWIFFVPWWFSSFFCTSSHTSSYSHNHLFISEGTSCNKNEKTFAVWRNLNTPIFFSVQKKIKITENNTVISTNFRKFDKDISEQVWSNWLEKLRIVSLSLSLSLFLFLSLFF